MNYQWKLNRRKINITSFIEERDFYGTGQGTKDEGTGQESPNRMMSKTSCNITLALRGVLQFIAFITFIVGEGDGPIGSFATDMCRE